MVAMNAETYAKDVQRSRPGRLPLYDSTWPRPALLKREDITVLGVPLARLCNENFNGVRTRILMKNICYAGVLAALLDLDLELIRKLLARDLCEEAAARRQQHEGDPARLRLREGRISPARCRCTSRRWTQTAGHIIIDGNTAAALGCVFAGATVAAWYPITPSTSLMDAFKAFCDRTARRSGDRPQELRVHPGGGRAGRDRHGHRRGVERRARVHRDLRARASR